MNVINFYIHSSHKLYNNYNLDIGGVCIRGYNNTAKFMEQDCCDAVISHLKLKGASFFLFSPHLIIKNLKEFRIEYIKY